MEDMKTIKDLAFEVTCFEKNRPSLGLELKEV